VVTLVQSAAINLVLVVFLCSYRCCKMHDWCYNTANCPMYLEYFVPYVWKCYRRRPLCGKSDLHRHNLPTPHFLVHFSKITTRDDKNITVPSCEFKVCKSVHHRTIQINHQPDATIFQFIILTFIYSSTCFGRFHAHHQELNDCSGSLWFYFHIWPARPRTTARLSPRYEGKTRGCHCSH